MRRRDAVERSQMRRTGDLTLPPRAHTHSHSKKKEKRGRAGSAHAGTFTRCTGHIRAQALQLISSLTAACGHTVRLGRRSVGGRRLSAIIALVLAFSVARVFIFGVGVGFRVFIFTHENEEMEEDRYSCGGLWLDGGL